MQGGIPVKANSWSYCSRDAASAAKLSSDGTHTACTRISALAQIQKIRLSTAIAWGLRAVPEFSQENAVELSTAKMTSWPFHWEDHINKLWNTAQRSLMLICQAHWRGIQAWIHASWLKTQLAAASEASVQQQWRGLFTVHIYIYVCSFWPPL